MTVLIVALLARRASDSPYGHDTEIAIHLQVRTRFDHPERILHACYTWDAVFARNDGAMHQHAAATLDNPSRQRDDKRHRRVDRVADEHLA